MLGWGGVVRAAVFLRHFPRELHSMWQCLVLIVPERQPPCTDSNSINISILCRLSVLTAREFAAASEKLKVRFPHFCPFFLNFLFTKFNELILKYLVLSILSNIFEFHLISSNIFYFVGVNFLVWDVGGQEKLRPLWKSYTRCTDGIIFVVDSCDTERLEEAKMELTRTARSPDNASVPILILANKQDLPGI